MSVMCKYCKKEYSSYSSRSNHIKKFHTNSDLQKLTILEINEKNITQNITKKEIKISEVSSEEMYECRKCKKKYNTRSGLWKHVKICSYIPTPYELSCEDCENMELNIKMVNKDELVLKLIKDNSEMMKIIKGQQEQINSIIPKVGNITNNNTTNNTTNNFNLNVFLNEKCKDALNISDFIDSLKITLDDLLFSKKNGISRGITDVMIKGLKELDIYKRPIHCTDIKRDIMYIKDEDKWYKDDNHDKIKNTIVKIADKERNALQLWANDNPDWIETEQKQIEYLTMVRSICEPIENYENYERKIIKHIEKEIVVDKNS
jgi:hypothetical protein